MGEGRSYSRRHFFITAGTLLGGVGLAQICRLLGTPTDEAEQPTPSPQKSTPTGYIGEPTPTPQDIPSGEVGQPTPTPQETPTSEAQQPTPATGADQPRVDHSHAASRVVHVWNSDATNWDFSTGYYGDYVNQNVVNEMVDQGLVALTGTSSVGEAWRQLIPDYQPGKALAIKVNFNNGGDPLQIDALIHPINSIVRGLELIEVRHEDVWVYDAVRCIPDRFMSGCLYPGVRFFDGWCHEKATFNSNDPNAVVHFSDHTQQVTDVVVDAAYLINMPIIKRHGHGNDFSVTLSFKNHYGTIHDPGLLHENRSSRLLDLNSNPHIRDKTRLVIGDALFGNWRNNSGKPERWETFGNGAPNSLLFATDPVAIDSVMCDFLAAEEWINYEPDQYLQSAEEAGLGAYERGDPWQQPHGSGYDKIAYTRLEA